MDAMTPLHPRCVLARCYGREECTRPNQCNGADFALVFYKEPTMPTTETPTLSHTAVASIPLPGGHEPTIENPVVVPHGWTVVNVADGRVWIRKVVG